MTQPVITLKNVRYAAFASQETACFSATVYVDGVALCTAENDGHGGADLYHPAKGKAHADIEAVDAALKAAAVRPEVVEDWEAQLWDDGYRPGLEEAVGAALDAHLLVRDLKRMLAKKTMFKEDGKVFEIKRKYDAAVEKYIRGKYPSAIILNALPLDEAVKHI